MSTIDSTMTGFTLCDMPDVLTIDEVAGVLRMSRNSVYTMAKSGEIPACRLGRRLIVYKQRLVDLLNGVALN